MREVVSVVVHKKDDEKGADAVSVADAPLHILPSLGTFEVSATAILTVLGPPTQLSLFGTNPGTDPSVSVPLTIQLVKLTGPAVP